MTWQDRERDRMATGRYKPVPVTLEYPKEHFLHLSEVAGEGDMVAYTPSDRHGREDRQVRLKFGRYLSKTFPALTPGEIQNYVTAFKAQVAHDSTPEPTALRFSTDVETINEIFETEMCACGSSVSSCMHGKFHGAIRPYHVYADSPDVAVAYIRKSTGAIVARSVVSTKTKKWVRAYADVTVDNDTYCGLLKQLLQDAGYTKGELTGSRLTMLDTSRVMLPYIDNGGKQVREDGGYWKVVEDGEGEYEANQTDGTAEECNLCPRCEHGQNDCECSYCDCCEEYYADYCDVCTMCEVCERCTYHDNCSCARCPECSQLLPGTRYASSYSICRCERCTECDELTEDCECEPQEEEEEEVEQEEVEEEEMPDPATMTYAQVRMKLNNAWVHLGRAAVVDEAARQIIKNAFDTITLEHERENGR